MKKKKIVKRCRLCGDKLESHNASVMLRKLEVHLEDCHPGFETLRNDFNKDY